MGRMSLDTIEFMLSEEEYCIAVKGTDNKKPYEQYKLEIIIAERIIQMLKEVEIPNDEDAWICTDYIMKDLGFKVEG